MLNKGQRTKEKLVQALLQCLGEEGLESTTFQSVADRCGVSQALVVKHFKNRENLLWSALEFIIAEARIITELKLSGSGSAKEKLQNYLSVSIEIFRSRKETAKIYMLMYYLSTHHPRYLDFNTRLKEIAVNRIAGILQDGIHSGEFSSQIDVMYVAKVTHSSLTGIILNSVTEKSDYEPERLAWNLWKSIAEAHSVKGPAG